MEIARVTERHHTGRRNTRPTMNGRGRRPMLGALIIILVLLAILPVIFMAILPAIVAIVAIVAVVLGWSLWRDGETRAEGSELVALNR